MTRNSDFFRTKVKQQLNYFHDYISFNLHDINNMEMAIEKQKGAFENLKWKKIKVGNSWSGRDNYYWIRFNLKLPVKKSESFYLVHADLGRTGNGNNSGYEGLVYLNKKIYQGIDSNHQNIYLDLNDFSKATEICLRLWTGLEGGGSPVSQTYILRDLKEGFVSKEVLNCYDYLRNIILVEEELSEDDPLKYKYQNLLDDIFKRFDWATETADTVTLESCEVNRNIKKFIDKYGNYKEPYEVTVIGHTHIDVAWLWRLCHTREKITRSFATVLRLMDEFPEYCFFQSTAQDYQFLKSDHLELYKKVLKYIKEGRWEADGSTWLEPDTNIPSGESLTRQFLYGKSFFKKLGTKQNVLWLPDVFGYSASLPQILRGFDITNFITSKLSWNDTNRIPHDTFLWSGIDGSTVLTQFIITPEPDADLKKKNDLAFTYNGQITPHTIHGVYAVYQDKRINDNLLLPFGFGDGGGGPTREEIKDVKILNSLPGMPEIKFGRVDQYLEKLKQNIFSRKSLLHTWKGELYLEYHRGTYTSQAKIKKLNRKAEYALRRLEIQYVEAFIREKVPYPSKEIYELWIILLRNQFHDILPGSAICEVYKDAYQEFEYLFNKVKSLKKGLHKLNSRKTDENKNYMILRNFLPWKRKSLVELPSGFIPRLDEHVVQYEKVKDQKVYTLIEVPAFGEIEVMELV